MTTRALKTASWCTLPWLLFGVALGLDLGATTPAHAMGERLVLNNIPITRCVITGVQGSFGFTESLYAITGICSEFVASNPAGTSTFENEREVRRIPWTAEGR